MKIYYFTIYNKHFNGYENGWDLEKDYICEPEQHNADEIGNTPAEIGAWANQTLRDYIADGINGCDEEVPANFYDENADADYAITLHELSEKLNYYIKRTEETEIDELYTLQLWEFEDEDELADETNSKQHLPERDADYEFELWLSDFAVEKLNSK